MLNFACSGNIILSKFLNNSLREGNPNSSVVSSKVFKPSFPVLSTSEKVLGSISNLTTPF